MANRAALQHSTPAHLRALTPSKRKRIESRIEELLAVLDAQDAPTEDLEPAGDDEPDNDSEGSLGWPEDVNQDRAIKACTNDDAGVILGPDREADDADSEPSNGSRGCTMDVEHFDQTHWASGGTDDREYDPADPPAGVGIDEDELDGDREDLEPSLGSLENSPSQVGWACSGTDDLEATTGPFDLEAAQ